MQFWHDPATRREIAVGVGITLAGLGVGAWLSPQALGLAAGLAVAYGAWFVASSYRRRRAIAQLSCLLDRILHGGAVFPIDDQQEGELAVLRSEIYKMTLTLRQQADLLHRDKQYLADALADISHQLRTPLTSTNMVVSFLQQPDLTPQRRGELLRELQTLLARMDWLIVALLKMSKIDAGTVQFEQQPVTLDSVIRAAMEPLAIPMELREQVLRIDGDTDAVFTGDAGWTTEAVENILKNCMEHTPPGGHIFVTAEQTPLHTGLSIRDSGAGIAPEDLPHIFERFYRGKNSQSAGFGIGLALARMIVSAQNGTLTAENHPQGGSLFTIKFYKQTI